MSAPFRALAGDSLIRNGYALIASSASTSVLGVVFWIAAARLYDEAQVGLGAVLISTMVSLSSASQLGFGNVLNRFLPTAGTSSGRLVSAAYATGMSASLVLSGIFVLAAPLVAPDLSFMQENSVLWLWFCLGVASWTVFALQDSALAGLRQTTWIPLENTAYAVSKLALLVAFAYVASAGLSIFAAWTIPLTFLLLAVNLFIFRSVLPSITAAPGTELTLRRIIKFFGWDYAGGLTLTLAFGIAPLLVLNNWGPDASAIYHLSWTITYSLYLIGRSMGISLLAEGVSDPRRLRTLAFDSFVYAMVPLTGAAVAISMSAPLVMGMFGETYSRNGGTVLSVLTLSTIPWTAITLHLSFARAAGWMRTVFIAQSSTLILVSSLGIAMVPSMGPLGMSYAWLTAHSIVLVGIIAASLLRNGRDQALSWTIGVLGALSRLFRTLTPQQVSGSPTADLDIRLKELVAVSKREDAASWNVLSTTATLSDTSVAFVGEQTTYHAVLKSAESSEGIAALVRATSNLVQIRRDKRLHPLGLDLPAVLARQESPSRFSVLEQYIDGHSGKEVLLDASTRNAALAATARAVVSLNHRSAKSTIVGDQWIFDWIEQPIARLADCATTCLSKHQRGVALGRVAQEQRAFWGGRKQLLGLSHGDLSPGNIIFSRAEPDELASIIDWDTARWDAPAELDLCGLALSTYSLIAGQEMGTCVRGALDGSEWLGSECSIDGFDIELRFGEPEALPNLVTFAWLQHVNNNIAKAHRYSRNRLWVAANVDWVLLHFLRDQ